MKILPVSLNLNNYSLGKNNDKIQKKSSASPMQNPFVAGDQVSFGIKYKPQHIYISSASELKTLALNGYLHCIWCGKPMLHQSETEYLLNKGRRLSKSSKDFTKLLSGIQEYLPPEYTKLVKHMAAYATTDPNAPFETLIKNMLPHANKKLLNKQFFIFHKLQKLRNNLPVELHKDFDILLQNSKNRVLEIPYESEYSAKEFCYKLNVLAKSVSSPVRKKKMMRYANILMHPTFKEPNSAFSKKFKSGLYSQLGLDPQLPENYIAPTDKEWKQKVELLVMRELQKLANREGRSDILRLCETTKDKINGVPTVVQFSNKAFKYKLGEIVDNLQDEKLKKKFFDIADELPSSIDNMYAFIVKNKDATAYGFLQKLLEQSQVTLEHIVPILRNTSAAELRHQNRNLLAGEKVTRGKNNLGNWSLAHSYCNGLHGHENIKGANFPFSKEAGIDYFRTMTEVANNGEISGASVIQMAKNYLKETGIKIKLKGLKYSPEY